MTRALMIRSNVRWATDMDEPEMRCESCARNERGPIWWPITKTFWDPKLGLSACRACHNAARRKARRAALTAKEKQRLYYHTHRMERLAWVKEYRNRDREGYNAKRRAAYARRVAAKREVEE